MYINCGKAYISNYVNKIYYTENGVYEIHYAENGCLVIVWHTLSDENNYEMLDRTEMHEKRREREHTHTHT